MTSDSAPCFGSRLSMLDHTGRNGGARRYVELEVVEHPSPGTLVASGVMGQWLDFR
jgi:hypothetical protein